MTMIDRRSLLVSGGALLTMTQSSRAFAAQEVVGPLRAAARDAWIYTLPLVEIAGFRALSFRTGRPNAFEHRRRLSRPGDREVTAPNTDTLYSSAMLDLRSGPVTVTIPPTGDRYFSLALMDMWSNNFAVLGKRTIGGQGGSFTIVGPNDAAAEGVVRAPTPWVWALARTLADGASDDAAANLVQDGLSINGPSLSALPALTGRRTSPWDVYFKAASQLMTENPPPQTDLAILRRITPLGLEDFDPDAFGAAERAEIAAGVVDARQALVEARKSVPVVNGWQYPRPSLGDFGQDYAYRGTVALSGLAALPTSEALYIQPVAEDGTNHLDINGLWRLHFAQGQEPPVEGFWSLSMYEVTAEGQFFLSPNVLDRYAIGDRTPGLTRNADGSLDIWISREDPGPDRRSNWLPAPQAGKCRMSLRAYLPKDVLRDGDYRLPALERV